MEPKSKVYDLSELIAQKKMSNFSKFLCEAGWELADATEPECFCLIAVGPSGNYIGPMYFESGINERGAITDELSIITYIGWLERAKSQAMKILEELDDGN